MNAWRLRATSARRWRPAISRPARERLKKETPRILRSRGVNYRWLRGQDLNL